MSPNRLPFKAYKMSLFMHEHNRRSTISSICFFLHKYGFQHVWENQSVGDKKLFIKELKHRLILSYHQEWTQSIQSNERYAFYGTFKSSISHSVYLDNVLHIKARNCLIRIRLGVSQLNTHKLRYKRNADMRCPACKSEIESEVHFVLKCPYYDRLRHEYIPKKYFKTPSLFKATLLFASENKSIMLNLSTYLYKALEMRAAICI